MGMGRLLSMVPALLMLVGLAACAGDPPNRDVDHHVNHPLRVGPEDVRVSFALPFGANGMSKADRIRFQRFIQDYLDRGRGAVMVEMVGGASAESRGEALRYMGDLLRQSGLRDQEISVLSGAGGGALTPAVALTFVARGIKLPTCGDWSSNSAYSPSNMTRPNFGCANQRNLGLMVADPSDLIESRPVTGRNSVRSNKVLTDYEEGGVTVSPKSAEQGTPTDFTTE